ncbi:MAG: glycosyltransferase family 2 protein [Candidatus Dormibacteraeota bacterium]|uniref:Glycosyltransferase family 2 protein n=1 Tax=Candidatus Amunia macphersoniae TaxID=3127014 RepID=A0A934NFU8_9BACT|nr:glycosyltransferase family 2 protein [Candidatus Dormibacteraeota bacterium]
MTSVASGHGVTVVIPTLNEVGSIAAVVERVRLAIDAQVIVADNGSTDGTAGVARRAGAVVVEVSQRGYGHACLAGVQAAAGSKVLVFLDGDGSMAPEDIPRLVAPILGGRADVVCGIRPIQSSGMPPHQRLGNRVIGLLLRRHGVRLPELCPFRAVRASTLLDLDLHGSRFAWPAQMLARAAGRGARIESLPVEYRERTAGRSKVGGSLRGSLAASWDISRVLIAEPVGPAARR